MGNIILNNPENGIYLSGESNIIKNNLIANNGNYGIHFDNSNNNILTGNTIMNNKYYGMFLHWGSSNNNLMYHNNFLYNRVNAEDDGSNTWDNGYPSGGNYWSDFDEPSEGAYDNNSDGIVDSFYNIRFGNRDSCPLMYPWIEVVWCPWRYDYNHNRKLEKSEVVNVIQDYFNGLIEQWQLKDVIQTSYRKKSCCWYDYDFNHDCRISQNEVIVAINDYFAEFITKEQLIEVLNLYFC